MKAWRWSKVELSPIGLDIGARLLRLLQISTDDPPRLAAAAEAVIPEELDNDPVQREAFIRQTLNDLLRAGGFRGRRAVMAIPSQRMHVQHVRVGKADDSALEDPVHMELRKRLGVDPARLVIRTIEAGQVFTDGAVRREVICMATGRSVVMDQIKLAAQLRLKVSGVHGQPQAIAAAFAHMFRRKEDEQRTTFFVDIGASMTKAIVLHGKDLAFAKMIHISAAQIGGAGDAALQELQSDEQRVAEPVAAAAAVGAPSEAASDGDRRANAAPPELTSLPAQTEPSPHHSPGEMLDCLIDELQLCAGYHRSLYPDRPIDRLVFLGGGSADHEGCRRVAAALQLPADLGDPLARLNRMPDAPPPVGLDLRERQAGWACPLGLCLLPSDL